ncbi:F-box domain-containing protein [Mycena kentingensis (nom. inval.)]|nr:F-box domain-containing protein [Mycena kentingensis (nom. inval.)]
MSPTIMSSSPFADILHTNAAPTVAQRHALREFTSPHRARVAALDDEIARLNALLDDVVRNRAEEQQLIDAHDALLSPLRALPVDIIQEVFVRTLPTDGATALIPTEGPLLLSRVCRDWRDIVHRTPSLYASLHILYPGTPLRVLWLLKTMESWLERARGMTLDISFVLSGTWDPKLSVNPVLQALYEARSRWRKMKLVLPFGHDTHPLSGIPPEEVPNLLSMELALFDGFELPETPIPVLFPFLATTALQSLVLRGPLQLLPSLDNVSYETLTHLELAVAPRSEVPSPFPILLRCTSLVSCILLLTDFNIAAPTPITLQHMRYLSVRGYNFTNHPSVFFSNLRLPSLESFNYGTNILGNGPEGDLSWLHTLLASGAGADRLTRLELEGHSFVDSEELVRLLQTTTRLERLSISGDLRAARAGDPSAPATPMWEKHPDGSFLARFILSAGSDEILCPLLTHLRLLGFFEMTDTLLSEFIQYRARSGLEHVFCTLRREPTAGVNPRLDEIKELDGVRLDVRYFAPGMQPCRKYSPLEGTEQSISIGDEYFRRDV